MNGYLEDEDSSDLPEWDLKRHKGLIGVESYEEEFARSCASRISPP